MGFKDCIIQLAASMFHVEHPFIHDVPRETLSSVEDSLENRIKESRVENREGYSMNFRVTRRNPQKERYTSITPKDVIQAVITELLNTGAYKAPVTTT